MHDIQMISHSVVTKYRTVQSFHVRTNIWNLTLAFRKYSSTTQSNGKQPVHFILLNKTRILMTFQKFTKVM